MVVDFNLTFKGSDYTCVSFAIEKEHKKIMSVSIDTNGLSFKRGDVRFPVDNDTLFEITRNRMSMMDSKHQTKTMVNTVKKKVCEILNTHNGSDLILTPNALSDQFGFDKYLSLIEKTASEILELADEIYLKRKDFLNMAARRGLPKYSLRIRTVNPPSPKHGHSYYTVTLLSGDATIDSYLIDSPLSDEIDDITSLRWFENNAQQTADIGVYLEDGELKASWYAEKTADFEECQDFTTIDIEWE